ncbi:GNAT family N-acetyltransferase [Tropicimonas sp.]|uniref:GNAT family N-acetyltransferase n=1 Tax=Tropicimonas sp. TaxID=2067044 RepID=UPI003A8B3A7D
MTDRHRLPRGVAAPMQQHATYGAACAALGSSAQAYRLTDVRGRIIGAAQILVRRWQLVGAGALLSRGPVWAPDLSDAHRRAALMSLLGLLRSRFCMLAVTPDRYGASDPLDESGWLETMTPCSFARLDLGPPPEDMRARMGGKWRNRLVRAEAGGIRVRHCAMPATADHWLFHREAAQARARRYRRLPPAFAVAWCGAGGMAASRLFTAEQGGRSIAAMLFLLHGRGATYHIGWSGAEGRAAGAHNLLLWQAMLWLRHQGITALDLDSVDTETAPGLARFKIGSGAEVFRLGATRIAAPGTRLFAWRMPRGWARARPDPSEAGIEQIPPPHSVKDMPLRGAFSHVR